MRNTKTICAFVRGEERAICVSKDRQPGRRSGTHQKRGAADRGLQKLKIELFDMKRNSCEGLQMIDIAKARETAKNLREWAKQIRRDAVTVPHATAREDSRLLDNAAKQLEEACRELERAKRKTR
jgi:hypothetical protein